MRTPRREDFEKDRLGLRVEIERTRSSVGSVNCGAVWPTAIGALTGAAEAFLQLLRGSQFDVEHAAESQKDDGGQ